MVSIRRTMSLQGGRMYPNGSDSPVLLQTPPQKLFPHSRTTFSPIKRFISGLFLIVHYPRKGNRLKRSLFSCMMFFFLGILLGMAPFENDSMLDIKSVDLLNDGFQAAVPVNVSELVVGGEVGVVKKLVDSDNLDASAISFRNEKNPIPDSASIEKPLVVVTPTYNRGLQAYYLNRLGQVLRLLKPPVLWIVVEAKVASLETADILRNLGVVYRHLVCKKTNTNVKDRGVHQRNTALEHIEKYKLNGIVYFADDDNVYTIELFESIRNISRFGAWPVGMMAHSKNKAILEGPVCSGNQVIGWHTNEKSKRLRRFHVDMSGFAFNSTILWDPKRWRRPFSGPIRQLDTVKEGFQETTFIEQIVEDESQMEAVPHSCSQIMNWHLHLDASEIAYPSGWILKRNLDVDIPSNQ